MGYREEDGFILRRRNIFEDDQRIVLLTPEQGGLKVRAPHARKSQKTYCGRLEVPNFVGTRLYKSRKSSNWVLTEIRILDSFADLMRTHDLRHQLWPLISLFRDLFPEGEEPGELFHRLYKGFELLQNGFQPPKLVMDRLLVKTATNCGINPRITRCAECGEELKNQSKMDQNVWYISMERGVFCSDCNRSNAHEVKTKVLSRYRELHEKSWAEVCGETYSLRVLGDLEELLYKFFHYHFEISLEALQIRQKL